MTAPILILGATGGVGRTLARTLAARGVPMILAARSSSSLSRPLSSKISLMPTGSTLSARRWSLGRRKRHSRRRTVRSFCSRTWPSPRVFSTRAVISAAKVRVNAVAPSLTRTPLADSLICGEAMAKGIAQLHAIPRLGEPEDIAAGAAFLLKPESAWITGQVIPVDDGRSRVRTKS